MQILENGIAGWDPDITEDQALLHLGTPSHSVCPYYTYENLLAKQGRIAFARSPIQAEIHVCHRRINRVGVGSGPGGSVRLGDDLIPADIKAVVAKVDLEAAREVWEDFQRRRYLNKPFSIFGDRWYDSTYDSASDNKWHQGSGRWRQGGAWPKVIENAIVIATALRRDTSKLEIYKQRHLSAIPQQS